MIQKIIACILIAGFMASCNPESGSMPPTAEMSAVTISPVPTQTKPSAVATVSIPQSDINPFTGLKAEDSRILDRRPVLIKVENLPRTNRPQYGLTKADLVYEYYTEEGTTRFAALFYGQDAEIVGPIRSARFVDLHLARMHKAYFIFGQAYQDLMNALLESDIAERLIIEGPSSCPALCRLTTPTENILYANTFELPGYLEQRGMDNTRQAFSGQGFSVEPASQGRDVNRIYIRFSGAIYNRWDYDAESKRYFRFVDQENASSESMEIYAPLTDKLTEQRIAVENLVVILADYTYVVDPDIAEVYDINLIGSGPAFLFRDGKAYDIRWERRRPEDLLLLTDKDGAPVMLRPGQSWYEILHTTSTTSELEDAVRFQLWLPAKDAP